MERPLSPQAPLPSAITSKLTCIPGRSLEEVKMLVKGMRLLTPREHFLEGQHQQQQQLLEQQQHHQLQQHERLSDSTLARRIIDSEINSPNPPPAPVPHPITPTQRRVAWADEQQSVGETATASSAQTQPIAAAIGMIVVPVMKHDPPSDVDAPPALVVTDVVLHSPAACAGLIPGDEITHVDGHRVLASDDVASRVAGPAGTCVHIRGIRDGAIVTFSVIRRAMWLAPPPPPPSSSFPPPPPSSSSPLPPPPINPVPCSKESPRSIHSSTAISALKLSLNEACVPPFDLTLFFFFLRSVFVSVFFASVSMFRPFLNFCL